MAEADRITPNDALAFVIEMAALVTLAAWGWRTGSSTIGRVALAVGAPAAAAVLWGAFAAPRSRIDVLALELATKIVVLGAALWAASTMIGPVAWWAGAVVVVANTVLQYVGPFSR